MSYYNQKEFLDAISESYKKYIEHGARSTEKIKPLHLFVANTSKEKKLKENIMIKILISPFQKMIK